MFAVQEGRLSVYQDGHENVVCKGELCLIDAARPFKMENTEPCLTNVLVLPREPLARRYPAAVARVAEVFPSDMPETALLHAYIVDAVLQGPALGHAFAAALQSAILTLIGSHPISEARPERSLHWRVARALADIDARLDDPELAPADIAKAQSIGRRQLDALFAEALQSTISAQIIERRLAAAALHLADPGQAGRLVIDVALSTGFSDSAHFTRAFQRRFGHTPTGWRKYHLAPSEPSEPSEPSFG